MWTTKTVGFHRMEDTGLAQIHQVQTSRTSNSDYQHHTKQPLCDSHGHDELPRSILQNWYTGLTRTTRIRIPYRIAVLLLCASHQAAEQATQGALSTGGSYSMRYVACHSRCSRRVAFILKPEQQGQSPDVSQVLRFSPLHTRLSVVPGSESRPLQRVKDRKPQDAQHKRSDRLA